MLSIDCLTGKSRQHLSLVPLAHSTAHFLQKDAAKAFLALQKTAKKAGFNLQPISCFRDFSRQQWIWNHKFNGIRKVHDRYGNIINLSMLDDWQRCEAILHWSSPPGASRHHWGTEIDFFDPHLLTSGEPLSLEAQAYQKGGCFFPLVEFLLDNIAHYDFELPYTKLPDNKKRGIEYWHLSYQPLAEKARQRLTPEVLFDTWKNEKIAGNSALKQRISTLFEHFIL